MAVLYGCCLMVDSYRIGLSLIPHGYHVPNPCNVSENNVWIGVGHTDQAGGGPLNSFGDDFLLTDRVRAILLRIQFVMDLVDFILNYTGYFCCR